MEFIVMNNGSRTSMGFSSNFDGILVKIVVFSTFKSAVTFMSKIRFNHEDAWSQTQLDSRVCRWWIWRNCRGFPWNQFWPTIQLTFGVPSVVKANFKKYILWSIFQRFSLNDYDTSLSLLLKQLVICYPPSRDCKEKKNDQPCIGC